MDYLDFLAEYREDNRIEAKRAQGGLPHSIWETYSAFANTDGGLILLGVVENKEDKSFSPVPLEDPSQLAADFWNTLCIPGVVSTNLLQPQDIQVVESQGLEIVVIRIPRATADQTPVYIGPNPFGGTYLRRGEGDYRCTPEEVHAMLQDADPTGAALRHRSRRDLISGFLVLHPNSTASQIAQGIGLSSSRVLFYLREMKREGTVTPLRRKKEVYYNLTF